MNERIAVIETMLIEKEGDVMIDKKFSNEIYQKFSISIIKDRKRNGHVLVADEDGYVYPTLHKTEQAAQDYLDTIIETLIKYV